MHIWNANLGAIEIEGAPVEETRRCYTALWHSMVQPRDRTGDHWDSSESFWDDHYTLWDSWKTLFPLLNIIDPATSGSIVNSFIARHKHNQDGYVATAFVSGVEYRTGQGGDEVENVIADAFLKKVPGVNWQEAYALLKHHADTSGRTESYRSLGYVPFGETAPYCNRLKSASGTLGFAINDFSVSEVAKGLGKTEDAERFRKRSENWKNVWDDSAEDSGYTGFPRGRRRDGAFTDTGLRKNYNVDFYEATSWEMAYAPNFALSEIVAKMGGKEKFVERLKFAFKNKWIDFGNEPSFMTPWLFAAMGRPDLSSYWADMYKNRYKGRELPGDDDQGAMSSMYIFLISGFFPIAGQDIYYLHGPSVPKTTWHLANGKTFVISAQNVSKRNIYIQSATLNGRPLNAAVIHYSDIEQGGTLGFVMGETPSKWGY
ncbi:MAG: glycoside hydrolase family 92 protein [Chthoniobacteraceae bacterium]